MSGATFLSTLSLRRATVEGDSFFYFADISIHALLAESDLFEYIQAGTGILFLSTLSLRRATFRSRILFNLLIQFLSTLSLRRATTEAQSLAVTTVISIHALLAESDHPYRAPPYNLIIFLSTLSLRRATHQQGCHQDY